MSALRAARRQQGWLAERRSSLAYLARAPSGLVEDVDKIVDVAAQRLRQAKNHRQPWFINPSPHVALMTAANLLGMPYPMLKHEIAEGMIVAVSVGVVGLRVPSEELIAAAIPEV